MRFAGSDRGVIILFAALAVSSIALKGAIGAPRYAPDETKARLVQQRVVSILTAQGFRISVQPSKVQIPIIRAVRGSCLLIVRDGRKGAATASVFADDARAIGPVRYLYRGATYDSPPGLRIRLAYLEANLLDRVGQAPSMHAPVGVAESQSCGRHNFGLDDVQITT
jgi:hypothetical protein